MKPIKQKVVLITGCGSGLGLSLAQQLYTQEAYRVVITARMKSMPLLRDLFAESDRFLIRELDVTYTDDIHKLVNEICCRWGAVDILINNAGVCFRSVVEHMDDASEMVQLQTNYLGPMALARAVLPVMREQSSGQIINISSASGIIAMPTMASYSASKHALEGASEALWYEAKPYGIHVSIVQPGFIKSDSHYNVVLSKKAQMSAKLSGPHSEYYKSMTPIVEKFMDLSMVTHDDIAQKIIRLFTLENPPLRLAVTPDVSVFKFLRRFMPARFFHALIFMLMPGSKSWGQAKEKEKAAAAA